MKPACLHRLNGYWPVVTSTLLLLFISFPLHSGESDTKTYKPGLHINAYFKTWFIMADNPQEDSADSRNLTGFSLPVVRLSPFGSFSKGLSWRITFSWDRLNADILDAYIDYAVSPTLSLRTGLFPVPGAISGALTPTDQLDCVERSLVTQFWNDNASLRVYRNVGMMLSGSIMQERAHYFLMIANSSGKDPFNTSLTQPYFSFPQTGLKFWGRIETQPLDSLDIGAFFSNTLINGQEMKNNSYGANLFFNLDRLYIKMEYIAGEFGLTDLLTEWRGFWMSVSYSVDKFMPILRYDSYTPKINGSDSHSVTRYDHLTVGFSYDARTDLRLQANVIFRNEIDLAGVPLRISNNLFSLNLQYRFDGKIL